MNERTRGEIIKDLLAIDSHIADLATAYFEGRTYRRVAKKMILLLGIQREELKLEYQRSEI